MLVQTEEALIFSHDHLTDHTHYHTVMTHQNDEDDFEKDDDEYAQYEQSSQYDGGKRPQGNGKCSTNTFYTQKNNNMTTKKGVYIGRHLMSPIHAYNRWLLTQHGSRDHIAHNTFRLDCSKLFKN